MAITLDGTNGINSSGVIVAPDGSASAPAITTDGDTNTGIFFPAADTIAFGEGGAEAMRIDSSCNLLVGSTSSTGNGPIQLGSTSASGPTSTLQFLTSTTDNSFIQFGDGTTGGDRYRGWIQYGHNGDFMGFATAENERMRIDSSGNLLVGTTSKPNSE